MFEVAART